MIFFKVLSLNTPALFESSRHLLRFYKGPILVPVLANWKNSEDFHLCNERQRQKWRSTSALLERWELLERQQAAPAVGMCPQPRSLGTALGLATQGHQSCELWLWAPVLYFDLFYVFVSKMCPEVSEKPQKSYILGLGMHKKFP